MCSDPTVCGNNFVIFREMCRRFASRHGWAFGASTKYILQMMKSGEAIHGEAEEHSNWCSPLRDSKSGPTDDAKCAGEYWDTVPKANYWISFSIYPFLYTRFCPRITSYYANDTASIFQVFPHNREEVSAQCWTRCVNHRASHGIPHGHGVIKS